MIPVYVGGGGDHQSSDHTKYHHDTRQHHDNICLSVCLLTQGSDAIQLETRHICGASLITTYSMDLC